MDRNRVIGLFIQGLVGEPNLISFRLRERVDSRGRPGQTLHCCSPYMEGSKRADRLPDGISRPSAMSARLRIVAENG
jgi:hypothetical protein